VASKVSAIKCVYCKNCQHLPDSSKCNLIKEPWKPTLQGTTYNSSNQLSLEKLWPLRVLKHRDVTAATMVVNTVVKNEERVWPNSRSLEEKVSSKNRGKSEPYKKKN